MDRHASYTYQRAWNYVMWLLSRKAYTISQLKERLKKKQCSPQTIEQVVMKLEDMHFVDDNRYAELYIHSRQHKKGKLKLRQELFQKGLDEDIISQTLNDLSDNQQTISAQILLEKQASKLQKADSKSRYAKAYAFLARRGFSGDVIRKVLEESDLMQD